MSAPVATIEARGPGRWAIRAERSLDGAHAEGEVLVHLKAPPSPAAPPHAALAGSRAWLSLGEARLAAKDAKGAIAAAQAGLDELGDDYAAPEVVDDTGMKLLAAEARIRTGHAEDGASVMLRMLRTRSELYAELHRDTIVH